MTAKGWFANSASISLNGATVGALRHVRMTPKAELEEIYGMGTILREKAVKFNFGVDVSVEYAMWDSSSDDLMNGFLAGATTGSGSVTDTIDCGEFTISAQVKNSNNTSTMTITASGVVFSEITVELKENEWMSRNISGKGSNFTIAYT
jgi:hypothetical protein